VPMVFDCQLERYNCAGLYFSSLSHLETLGLVQFNNIAGFRLTKRPKMIAVVYYQRPLELTFPKDLDNGLVVGKVLLTRAGHELARVCDCDPEDGFFDYVYDIWANQSLVPKREQGPTS